MGLTSRGRESRESLINKAEQRLFATDIKYWGTKELDLLSNHQFYYYLFTEAKKVPKTSENRRKEITKLAWITDGLLEIPGTELLYIDGLALTQVFLLLEYELKELQTGIKSSYEKKFLLSYLGVEKDSELWSYDIEDLLPLFMKKLFDEKTTLSTGIVNFLFGSKEQLYDGYVYKLLNEFIPQTEEPAKKAVLLEILNKIVVGLNNQVKKKNQSDPMLSLRVEDALNKIEYAKNQPEYVLAAVELSQFSYMLRFLGKDWIAKLDPKQNVKIEELTSECYKKILSSYKGFEIIPLVDFMLKRMPLDNTGGGYYSFLKDILFPEIYRVKNKNFNEAVLMSLTVNDIMDVIKQTLSDFSKKDIDPVLGEGTYDSWVEEYNKTYSEKRSMDLVLGTMPKAIYNKDASAEIWSYDRIASLYNKVIDSEKPMTSKEVGEAVDYVEYLLKGSVTDGVMNKCTILLSTVEANTDVIPLSATTEQKMWLAKAKLFKAKSNVSLYRVNSNFLIDRVKVMRNLKEYSGQAKEALLSMETLETLAIKKIATAINEGTAGEKDVKMLIGENGYLYYFVTTVDSPAKAGAFLILSEFAKTRSANYNSYAWNECLIKYDEKIKELKVKNKDFDVDFDAWVEKYRQKSIDIKTWDIKPK